MGWEGVGIGACSAGWAGVNRGRGVGPTPVLFTPLSGGTRLGGNEPGGAASTQLALPRKRWGATGSCIVLPCLLDPATLRQRLSAQTNNGPDNVLMQRLHFLDATWEMRQQLPSLDVSYSSSKTTHQEPLQIEG